MIFLAGHYDVCRRYAHDSRLGREGQDWCQVNSEQDLRGIEGFHRNPASSNHMIVLWYEPGYFGNDARFFSWAKAAGLLK